VDEKDGFIHNSRLNDCLNSASGGGTVALKGKWVGEAGRQRALLGRLRGRVWGRTLSGGPGTGGAAELAMNDRKGERLKETLRIT
jgi:hypothetical protein